MLFAAVARCPVFGGKAAKVDSAKAKKVPGVRHVIEIPSGVAVVGDNTWAAFQGREALKITWDEGPNAKESSVGIRSRFVEAAGKPGTIVKKFEPPVSKAPPRIWRRSTRRHSRPTPSSNRSTVQPT
jgi:isoquinoline 1-oxidoreductase subunit beta